MSNQRIKVAYAVLRFGSTLPNVRRVIAGVEFGLIQRAGSQFEESQTWLKALT